MREEREGGGGTREVKVFSCQASWLERPRYGLSASTPSSDSGAPKSLLQALLGWKQPEPWGSEACCRSYTQLTVTPLCLILSGKS